MSNAFKRMSAILNEEHTKCKAYLNLPDGSYFRFTGVGSNGLIYKKIDDGVYRQGSGYNAQFDLPSTFIQPIQNLVNVDKLIAHI